MKHIWEDGKTSGELVQINKLLLFLLLDLLPCALSIPPMFLRTCTIAYLGIREIRTLARDNLIRIQTLNRLPTYPPPRSLTILLIECWQIALECISTPVLSFLSDFHGCWDVHQPFPTLFHHPIHLYARVLFASCRKYPVLMFQHQVNMHTDLFRKEGHMISRHCDLCSLRDGTKYIFPRITKHKRLRGLSTIEIVPPFSSTASLPTYLNQYSDAGV
jgi:hypothetical protein